MLSGVAGALGRLRKQAAGLFTPLKRRGISTRSIFGGGSGVGRSGSLLGDALGFQNFLGEVGKFNPLYVEPWMMKLMRRAVMPRLALIIMGAALREKSYAVVGGLPEVRKFHQDWIDGLLPQLLRSAPLAVWYGWQPFILDWTVTERGEFVPFKARDLDPNDCEIIETEVTKDFAGVLIGDQFFDASRAFKLTWEGEHGNHYGCPMALTVYPYWWAWSVLLCWTMRYYERSVDPVRMAMAQNVSVATGEVDSNGDPVYVDLTELVAEALDIAAGGDSVAFPLGDEGEKLVNLETLKLEDRSDAFMKMLAYLEEKQFTGSLMLPNIGVASTGGDVKGQDSRVTEKTQLRILDHVSELVIEPLNELIAQVHRQNRKPGPPPRVEGRAFKREQQEMLLELFSKAMAQPFPEVRDGVLTGQAYRPGDLLMFDEIAKALNIPSRDVEQVARSLAELLPQAPGEGGRPSEPLNDPSIPSGGDVSRPEARAAGRDR